jgi:hypothetical protein
VRIAWGVSLGGRREVIDGGCLEPSLDVGFDVRVKSWIDGDAKIIEEEEETTM